jgi:hypothetical protein
MSVQFNKENPHEWDSESHPERWAKHRTRYLERVTEFDTIACKIIAWAEIGRSHHGIAKRIDVSKGTVTSRMDRIDEQDPTALLTRVPAEIAVQSPVGIDGTRFGGDE